MDALFRSCAYPLQSLADDFTVKVLLGHLLPIFERRIGWRRAECLRLSYSSKSGGADCEAFIATTMLLILFILLIATTILAWRDFLPLSTAILTVISTPRLIYWWRKLLKSMQIAWHSGWQNSICKFWNSICPQLWCLSLLSCWRAMPCPFGIFIADSLHNSPSTRVVVVCSFENFALMDTCLDIE